MCTIEIPISDRFAAYIDTDASIAAATASITKEFDSRLKGKIGDAELFDQLRGFMDVDLNAQCLLMESWNEQRDHLNGVDPNNDDFPPAEEVTSKHDDEIAVQKLLDIYDRSSAEVGRMI